MVRIRSTSASDLSVSRVLKRPAASSTQLLHRRPASSAGSARGHRKKPSVSVVDQFEQLFGIASPPLYELARCVGLSLAQSLGILSCRFRRNLLYARTTILAAHPEIFCVVGGRGVADSNDLFSAEYFDACKNRWVDLPSMNVRRFGPLVCSAGGMIYAGGGEVYGPNGRKSWERLNPSLCKWELLPKMEHFRTESVPCALGDYIYVCGNGYEMFGNNFDRFKLSTQVWQKLPRLRRSRADATAICYKGRVLIVGGVDIDSEVSRCEYFDPVNMFWEDAMDLRTPRKGSACALHDDMLYICGGALEYDDLEDNNVPGAVTLVERFSFETESWEVLPSMLEPRYAAACKFVGGLLYVVGGANSTGRLSSAERYCPASNAWEKLPPMSTVRMRPGAAVVREVVHADPSVPVIIPSSYSDHDETHSEREDKDDEEEEEESLEMYREMCHICEREPAAELLGGVECWSCFGEH